MAFQAAAHPAYVSVIMMVVPVIFIHRRADVGRPGFRGNRRAGFGLLAIAAYDRHLANPVD
jgi:hypothetical protein